MEIEPGTIVANRYRVLRPLGRGGMGEVLAAENMRTGRSVAIKVLHADAKAKHSAVERFKREARAAGSINSDYVTQVLDVEEDPVHGIVLVFELLEGESLIDRLKRTGPIPYEELWGIIEKVWIGLADAHRVGIVHRDLKPSNIFLEHRPDGTTRVKILDFGISKLPKEMESETLTEMGQSLGTFSFMPPEQIGKAKLVDHRADIYACTTMIYQSLTAQLPYVAKNVLVMVELKTKEPPRTLADALEGPVDPRLEAFVAKGLARDADQRFQSAVEALAAWRELAPQGAGQTSPHAGRSTPTPVPWQAGQVPVSRSQAPASPRALRGTSALDAATRAEPKLAHPPLTAEPTSDDSAATLAMPIARLLPPPGAGPSWPPVNDPRLGGTVMMPAGPSRPPAYDAPPPQNMPGAKSSGSYGLVQPPAQPVASPGYAPAPPAATNAQPYPSPSMGAPPKPQQSAWPQQTGPYQAAELAPREPARRPVLLYVLVVVLCVAFGAGVVAVLMTRT